jgi:GNAT superfamily N-acetyltransferase
VPGVTLRDATADSTALEPFLKLPGAVYRGDPDYSASSRQAVLAGLNRPEFQAAQRAWVALEGGKPAARIVARLSPQLRDDQDRPYGLLGFFEALDRPAAVGRLFEEAVGWLRQAGAGPILGPMDGDTWHRYRINAGPFDEPPFLLEPYNPPYYARLWEDHGFRVLERYYSKRVDAAAVANFCKPRGRAALEAGYRLRPLDSRRFEDELKVLYRLSRVIFARNFLYTEIPEGEFVALYAGSRPILDPGLVAFAHAPDGPEVGFLFAYPDRFRAVAAMRGRRGPLAKLRFLLHRNEIGAVDFKTLGVLPEHRRSGVAAALFHYGHQAALDRGFRVANHCLYKEGNPSGELDGGAGRLLRTYHLYQLAEGPGA